MCRGNESVQQKRKLFDIFRSEYFKLLDLYIFFIPTLNKFIKHVCIRLVKMTKN